jgi:predicted HTH domain antitoxin
MQTLTVTLPERIAVRLAAASSDPAVRIQLELALNLYSLGEITHAEACQLAGMSRIEFEEILQQRQIVRPYTIQMLDEDLSHADRG